MSRRVAHVFEEKWRSNDVVLQEDADFSTLLLSDRVLKGLRKAGFKKPSPIQLDAIPIGRYGKDLMIQAKSGTGKTLVFTVVALEMLLESKCPQVLILAPTREVATQICDVINTVGSAFKKLQCYSFIGGICIENDRTKIHSCQIVVGTPGRIKQLIDMKSLRTNSIRLLVFDEVDQILGKSFINDIDSIFFALPKDKQVIATSATYPKALKKLVLAFLRDPYIACLTVNELALLGTVHYIQNVKHIQMAGLQYNIKVKALEKILTTINFSQCLVFCNLISRVECLCGNIKKWGFTTTFISSAKEQGDRLKAIERLKKFKCKVLVSSDVTARGIDAENVDLIINFDLPFSTEVYLHRVGRAGRYGSKGIAITFIAGEEEKSFRKMQSEAKFKAYQLPDPTPADLIEKPSPQSPSDEESSSSDDTVVVAAKGVGAIAEITKNSLIKRECYGNKIDKPNQSLSYNANICHSDFTDESTHKLCGSLTINSEISATEIRKSFENCSVKCDLPEILSENGQHVFEANNDDIHKDLLGDEINLSHTNKHIPKGKMLSSSKDMNQGVFCYNVNNIEINGHKSFSVNKAAGGTKSAIPEDYIKSEHVSSLKNCCDPVPPKKDFAGDMLEVVNIFKPNAECLSKTEEFEGNVIFPTMLMPSSENIGANLNCGSPELALHCEIENSEPSNAPSNFPGVPASTTDTTEDKSKENLKNGGTEPESKLREIDVILDFVQQYKIEDDHVACDTKSNDIGSVSSKKIPFSCKEASTSPSQPDDKIKTVIISSADIKKLRSIKNAFYYDILKNYSGENRITDSGSMEEKDIDELTTEKCDQIDGTSTNNVIATVLPHAKDGSESTSDNYTSSVSLSAQVKESLVESIFSEQNTLTEDNIQLSVPKYESTPNKKYIQIKGCWFERDEHDIISSSEDSESDSSDDVKSFIGAEKKFLTLAEAFKGVHTEKNKQIHIESSISLIVPVSVENGETSSQDEDVPLENEDGPSESEGHSPESEGHSSESEDSSLESEDSSSESEDSSSESEDSSSESEDSSSESEDSSSESEDSSSEIKDSSSEIKDSSSEIKDSSSESETISSKGAYSIKLTGRKKFTSQCQAMHPHSKEIQKKAHLHHDDKHAQFSNVRYNMSYDGNHHKQRHNRSYYDACCHSSPVKHCGNKSFFKSSHPIPSGIQQVHFDNCPTCHLNKNCMNIAGNCSLPSQHLSHSPLNYSTSCSHMSVCEQWHKMFLSQLQCIESSVNFFPTF